LPRASGSVRVIPGEIRAFLLASDSGLGEAWPQCNPRFINTGNDTARGARAPGGWL